MCAILAAGVYASNEDQEIETSTSITVRDTAEESADNLGLVPRRLQEWEMWELYGGAGPRGFSDGYIVKLKLNSIWQREHQKRVEQGKVKCVLEEAHCSFLLD